MQAHPARRSVDTAGLAAPAHVLMGRTLLRIAIHSTRAHGPAATAELALVGSGGPRRGLRWRPAVVGLMLGRVWEASPAGRSAESGDEAGNWTVARRRYPLRCSGSPAWVVRTLQE